MSVRVRSKGPHSAGPSEATAPADRRGAASTERRLWVWWSEGSFVFDLPAKARLRVGRAEDADIRIDHDSVSRAHALIEVDDEIRVQDLGSSNGTFVDGKRLQPNRPRIVGRGALIELGSVLLAVHGTDSKPVPSAAEKLVLADPVMLEVIEQLDLVAKSRLNVILLGETGVGKDVLAARVHARSPRAQKSFVRINCAAMPLALLESELFGHERGAFTDASSAKAGLLEEADGGTFFLDEVGELPLGIQPKLLGVLENGEVTRVGAVKARKVDVRWVAATNRDLRSFVARGLFREDLYFRLNGISIVIPPLRERPREIPLLAKAFVLESCAAAKRAPLQFAEDALARLVKHPWPGNIRELRNVIARSVALCSGDVLREDDLRFDRPERASAPQDDERARILDALARAAGNQTRAARMLGISRRTLVNRLNELGLPRPRK
jgi:transcriptional regulator with GAF, ATPase, and Fis domain